MTANLARSLSRCRWLTPHPLSPWQYLGHRKKIPGLNYSFVLFFYRHILLLSFRGDMRGHNICRLFQPLPSTLLVFPSLWFLFLTILCIWFLQITFYFLLSYFLTHPIKKILIVILDKYSEQGRVNGLWENVNTFNTTIGIMQRKNHNRSKDDTLLPKDILMAIPAEHILF